MWRWKQNQYSTWIEGGAVRSMEEEEQTVQNVREQKKNVFVKLGSRWVHYVKHLRPDFVEILDEWLCWPFVFLEISIFDFVGVLPSSSFFLSFFSVWFHGLPWYPCSGSSPTWEIWAYQPNSGECEEAFCMSRGPKAECLGPQTKRPEISLVSFWCLDRENVVVMYVCHMCHYVLHNVEQHWK